MRWSDLSYPDSSASGRQNYRAICTDNVGCARFERTLIDDGFSRVSLSRIDQKSAVPANDHVSGAADDTVQNGGPLPHSGY